MKVRLIEDWKSVLTRAWSVRLILLTGLLSGLQAALGVIPFEFVQLLPAWVWPVVTLLVSAGALISRLVLQEALRE